MAFAGIWDWVSGVAMAQNSRLMKAIDRMAHAHPNRSDRNLRRTGFFMPTKDAPVEAIPVARPLHSKHQGRTAG